jgi:protein-S-isoprenylcysteine O-methyltransferase Ste14
MGFLLLLGRRLTSPPQKIQDVLVPMSATFFYLMYDAIPLFPAWLKNSFCPTGWQVPTVIAGVCLNLVGLWIAMWAAVYLGRSFGVLIEVRTVVLQGAYRRMRHPMYLGYLFFLAGFAVANFSLAYFILIPMHMYLLIYRARLEETRLAEFSPEYREYQKHTGFIFPKFRQP